MREFHTHRKCESDPLSTFTHCAAQVSPKIISRPATPACKHQARALLPGSPGEHEIEFAAEGRCKAGQGELEVAAMAKDERDILEILKDELSFIEKGGYGRSVSTPWKPTSAFRDSLTCINFADPKRTHPCNECHLLDFVRPEQQGEDVPCHFIPLNEAGETIEALELQDNQAKLEREVRDWLRAKIREIEEDRLKPAIV